MLFGFSATGDTDFVSKACLAAVDGAFVVVTEVTGSCAERFVSADGFSVAPMLVADCAGCGGALVFAGAGATDAVRAADPPFVPALVLTPAAAPVP